MNAILVTFNGNYFKYFSLFYKSLRRNYPDYPALIVLCQALNPEQLAFLNKIPRIHIVDIDTLEVPPGPGLKGRETDTRIYYARFFIFTEQFDQFDSILYLDIDVVVLKPLTHLFEQTEFLIFQEAYCDVHPIIRTNVEKEKLNQLIKVDQLPEFPDVGANAGIFLAPKSFRTPENFNSLIDIKNRYEPYLIWADQSVINLWMLKHRIPKTIDYRYNFQPLLLDKRREQAAYRDMYLFHFNGMVVTGHLELLMNMATLCWRVPVLGRMVYYLIHRFLFTQNTVRYPKLEGFMRLLNKPF